MSRGNSKAEPDRATSGRLRRLVATKEFGVLLAILVVGAVFASMSDRFLTVGGLVSVLTISVELGVIAIAMTLLMTSGEFDLSVGSVFALTPVVMVIAMGTLVIPMPAAFALALLVAAAIGLLNGMITLRFQIPSFITTLGMLMFWRGIVLATTGGRPVTHSGESALLSLLSGYVWGNLRASTIWFIVLTLVMYFVLERTKYGNWVFATGGNRQGARQLGVPVGAVKLRNFVLTATFAGFAGVMQFGRLGSMSPVQGEGLELEAIAAAVIGGTSLFGGKGSVLGAFFGAFLVGMIRSGLVLVGAPGYWYRSFVGLILIGAVILNTYATRRGQE